MALSRVIDSFENLTRIVETLFLSKYMPIYNSVFNYGRGGCDWQLTPLAMKLYTWMLHSREKARYSFESEIKTKLREEKTNPYK